MSDFDKEAERERLREKYERDQQKREATEKMSELLLQGATMTNAHCSECGDPVFRYDGQEFCATCERAIDRDAATEGDGNDDDNAQQGGIEVTSPDDETRVKFGGDSEAGREQLPDENADRATDRPSQQADRTPRERARPGDASQPETPQSGPEQQDTPTREVPGIDPDAETTGHSGSDLSSAGTERTVPATRNEADVTTARASLVRTLQRFSEQAEATEDPQRAREHLAAAREAAETLAALRR